MNLINNKLSLKLSLYPGHEFISTNDLPLGELIMIQISPKIDVFNFPGSVTLNGKSSKIVKDMSICIDNSTDLLFQATKSLTQSLLSMLCKDYTQCSQKDQLNDFKDKDELLVLHMQGKVIQSASLKDGRRCQVV